MIQPGDAGIPTAELSSFGNSYMSPTTPGTSLTCVWGDHAQELREILADNRLPQIVKICDEDVVQSPGDGTDTFNFHQPLLLFKEVRPTRIFARNVTRDQGARARVREVGPYVVIPLEYPGVFKFLDPDDTGDNSLTALSTVARVMPATFLSLQKVRGYVTSQKREETTVYEKRDIPPGIFNVVNMHEDHITYINSRKSEKRKLILCLRCKTEDGSHEVLFPYDTAGEFYIVDFRKNSSRNQVNASSCVHRISDIVRDFDATKDAKFELIYGDPPSQECQFTGILRISHVTKEHSVIACTLNPAEPRVLELSVSPHPKFQLALHTADHHSDQVKAQCIAYMKTASEKFRRDLKVKRNYDIEKRDLREENMYA